MSKAGTLEEVLVFGGLTSVIAVACLFIVLGDDTGDIVSSYLPDLTVPPAIAPAITSILIGALIVIAAVIILPFVRGLQSKDSLQKVDATVSAKDGVTEDATDDTVDDATEGVVDDAM
jgi:hypothetical protein